MKIPESINTEEKLRTYLIQYALMSHGSSPGILDGVYGPKTEGAFNALLDSMEKTEDVPEYAKIAHSFVGVKEVAGPKSNPTILGWIKQVFPWATDDSKVAWCAIFMNEMLGRAGLRGTGKANARSFLKWGRPSLRPKKGDVVVFWRESPNSWKGHVGIYWGRASSTHIYCLGGNQRNACSIAKYPVSQVLEYREPRK